MTIKAEFLTIEETSSLFDKSCDFLENMAISNNLNLSIQEQTFNQTVKLFDILAYSIDLTEIIPIKIESSKCLFMLPP